MNNDYQAMCGGEITILDIKENMQAIRTVQKCSSKMRKDSEEYKALQIVLARASEAVADIAEEKGFDDLSELEYGLNSTGVFITKYQN